MLSVTGSYDILIVEDEILFSDIIARKLSKLGHRVVGQAISCSEAEYIYSTTRPDLVLIDIRLSGKESGIDLAEFFRSQADPPAFIFLTAQTDAAHLDRAKRLLPGGYLAKPVHLPTLVSTIEMVMFAHQSIRDEGWIEFKRGRDTLRVRKDKILYVQADHVYVRVYLADQASFLHRGALAQVSESLPRNGFLQTHRSYIVNLYHVTAYEAGWVWIDDQRVPVSRGRREGVREAIIKNTYPDARSE